MNTKFKFLAFATAGFLAMAPAPVMAQDAPPLDNPLVGVWQLVSVTDRIGSEDHVTWLGKQPTGTLICLPSGTYSMQILRDPPPVQDAPGILPLASDDEKVDAAKGYFSEFGTYMVWADSGHVTFWVKACLWPNIMVDGRHSRSFEARGDQLEFRITWRRGDVPCSERWEWKRLNVEPKGQVYSLVSVEVLTPDGKPDPEQGKWMGDHPTGQLIDLSAGYYALQVLRDPPPRQSTGATFLQEVSTKDKLAAVLGYYADYGTCAYDPATAVSTSHLLGSLWPNLRGRDLRTHPEMDGDRLISTTDPIDAGNGKALVYRWTWEAVKPGKPGLYLPSGEGEWHSVP